MGKGANDLERRVRELEGGLAKIEKSLNRLDKRLGTQGPKVRSLERKLDTRIRRESVMMEALGITHLSKPGDKGFLDDLDDSILRLEEYLLRTSDRIDNILRALKNHREFLVRMNKRMSKVGARERMEMGLTITKNTLSILALNGVGFDAALIQEIDTLLADLDKEDSGLTDLQKRKRELDSRVDGELRKFDLETIYSKKTELPGYQ